MAWPEPPRYYETPKVGYKVFLQEPSFPVIYPEPTFGQCFVNLRPNHWALAAAMTATGFCLGYYKGSAEYRAKSAAYFGAYLFGQTGLGWCLVDMNGILKGFRQNDREVQNIMPGMLTPREAY